MARATRSEKDMTANSGSLGKALEAGGWKPLGRRIKIKASPVTPPLRRSPLALDTGSR
jgi:hypothetical protein